MLLRLLAIWLLVLIAVALIGGVGDAELAIWVGGLLLLFGAYVTWGKRSNGA